MQPIGISSALVAPHNKQVRSDILIEVGIDGDSDSSDEEVDILGVDVAGGRVMGLLNSPPNPDAMAGIWGTNISFEFVE